MPGERHAEYLKRAADCEEKAARAATSLSREMWTEAAATWRELAALQELMTRLDQFSPEAGQDQLHNVFQQLTARF